jgi:hypothetical protein
MKLGEYLKYAVDQYADLRNVGNDIGPDALSVYVESKMESWNPSVGGKSLLDPQTRSAAARFLAGVAVNFARK